MASHPQRRHVLYGLAQASLAAQFGVSWVSTAQAQTLAPTPALVPACTHSSSRASSGTNTTPTRPRRRLANKAKKGFGIEFDQSQESKTGDTAIVDTEATLNALTADDPSLKPWIDRCRNLIEQAGHSNSPDLKERVISAWAHTGRARVLSETPSTR